MRCSLVFIFACVAGTTVARGADQPISAAKLLLIRSGSVEKLVFVSKDPAFLFPAVASQDDPGTGTPAVCKLTCSRRLNRGERLSPRQPESATLDGARTRALCPSIGSGMVVRLMPSRS